MKVWSKEVFARNLRRYAERSDKSQKEIAEVVHVSTATVSDWFNGKKFPRIDKIEALADYFGILKSDLIEDKTEEREKMQKNNDVMTDIVLRLRTDNEYLSICVLLKDFNKEQLQDAEYICSLLKKFNSQQSASLKQMVQTLSAFVK